MKELDVLLTDYLDNSFIIADQQEQQTFRALLDMPDPDLYALLMGRTISSDAGMIDFINKLKNQAGNK